MEEVLSWAVPILGVLAYVLLANLLIPVLRTKKEQQRHLDHERLRRDEMYERIARRFKEATEKEAEAPTVQPIPAIEGEEA
jgi:uncharacterized membrane protein